MKTQKLLAAALSAAIGFTPAMTAQALPLPTAQPSMASPIQLAAAKVKIKTWRGHRGYRYKRPGYRHYNGYWYPPAAFVVKVRPGNRWSSRHVRWCRNHYASYRLRDNSWKPRNGARRQCVSPYR